VLLPPKVSATLVARPRYPGTAAREGTTRWIRSLTGTLLPI